ncbi:MAG: hypothetical protein RIC53_07940 [Cyclobacteriaceae bacterium]
MLSKIMYVDIVGEEGSVHQQKVSMTEGRGEGAFFIPSTIPSGRYYLLAYTRWMTNFDDYFQAPLLIINPYEAYPNLELSSVPKLTFRKDLKLVSGVQNDIAYHLDVTNPKSFTGKLVDDAGQEVSKIQIDGFGIGSVQFTPQKSAEYQILLADTAGNVSFHPLPKVSAEGYQIDFEHKGSTLNVKVSSDSEISESLQLSLSAVGQEIFRQPITTNKFYSFKLESSRYAMLTTEVQNQNGQTVAQRNTYVDVNRIAEVAKVDTFSTRSEVNLDFDAPVGTYSVSVRKKLALTIDQHLHAVHQAYLPILDAPVSFNQYMTSDVANQQALIDLTSFDESKEITEYVKWLPEVREEILTGKLRDSTGIPVRDQFVSLTFPEEDYQLRVSKTNASGQFTIPYKSSRFDHLAVLSTIHPYAPYEFVVQEAFMETYPEFNFKVPYLDSGMVAKLLARNVNVQLLNAYFTSSPIDTKSNGWTRPFQYDDQYILDDYERFPTLKETFTEYIVSANIRENREQVIQTTFNPGIGQSKLPPLILLDGVPVLGEDVFDLNPINVHSIDIILNQSFLGPLAVDGVVDIGTKNHQLDGFSLLDYHHEIQVMGIGDLKDVPTPEWLENPNTHVPDLREQLLWIPNCQLTSSNNQVSFYTSDVSGEYDVIVEGFDTNGTPITMEFKLYIKQNLKL